MVYRVRIYSLSKKLFEIIVFLCLALQFVKQKKSVEISRKLEKYQRPIFCKVQQNVNNNSNTIPKEEEKERKKWPNKPENVLSFSIKQSRNEQHRP